MTDEEFKKFKEFADARYNEIRDMAMNIYCKSVLIDNITLEQLYKFGIVGVVSEWENYKKGNQE